MGDWCARDRKINEAGQLPRTLACDSSSQAASFPRRAVVRSTRFDAATLPSVGQPRPASAGHRVVHGASDETFRVGNGADGPSPRRYRLPKVDAEGDRGKRQKGDMAMRLTHTDIDAGPSDLGPEGGESDR